LLLHGDSRESSTALGKGKTGEERLSLKGRKSILPASTLIALKSVSMPLGREASVGLVGDGGKKKIRGEGFGEGLDTSVTPGILMVDETRRRMGPLAN